MINTIIELTEISRMLVPENQRVSTVASLWGPHWAIQVEPTCWDLSEKLAPDYQGGYWNYYGLGNAGFYMAPDETESFSISSENYFTGTLSADALGVVTCLLCYYHLSFSGDWEFPQVCAKHYHLLWHFTLGHPEASSILKALV